MSEKITSPLDNISDDQFKRMINKAGAEDAMKPKPEFIFGDLVVYQGNIGVVVKTWDTCKQLGCYSYEVYIRMDNDIEEIPGNELERMVVHKYVSEEDKKFYK